MSSIIFSWGFKAREGKFPMTRNMTRVMRIGVGLDSIYIGVGRHGDKLVEPHLGGNITWFTLWKGGTSAASSTCMPWTACLSTCASSLSWTSLVTIVE